MTAPFRISAAILHEALRVAIACGCLAGIWWSWKTARADALYRKDTPESIRDALRLVPDEPDYYTRLARLDGGHAPQLLETAIRLDRHNAAVLIELALKLETEGEHAAAERLLLEAFAVDRTYLTRWSLANFYLRRDNMPAFWIWAHKAAEMPADDMSALFQLCWRVNPDGEFIAKSVLTDNPATIRQYLDFLLTKGEVRAVAEVAPRLLQRGDGEVDRTLLLDTINRLIAAGDAGSASMLWRHLIDRRWVVADATAPNNATFMRQPLPVAFDWILPDREGLHSWPGPSGLEVEFSGRQPEDCEVTEQIVPLSPGDYDFLSSYRTTDIAPGTGLRWQITDAGSNALLAASADLSSPTLKTESTMFTVTATTPLIRLRLQYQRASGTPRIEGMLVVISTAIRIHLTRQSGHTLL